jgi:hypothetical protein
MWKVWLVVLVITSLFTGLTAWVVPILWMQGSSAAFNFGGFLCVMTVAAWIAAYNLLKPPKKVNK